MKTKKKVKRAKASIKHMSKKQLRNLVLLLTAKTVKIV
jgi:hypothetical protein